MRPGAIVRYANGEPTSAVRFVVLGTERGRVRVARLMTARHPTWTATADELEPVDGTEAQRAFAAELLARHEGTS